MTDVLAEGLHRAGDGVVRCWWAGDDELYGRYHDEEWGVPVGDERSLFELLCLEGFQAGLSWITILRKRENLRAAFDGFDIDTVAAYGPADVERLMADAGIVRNRAKVEAAIANAAAAQRLDEGLDALLWSFAPTGPRRRPASLADVPATSAESVAMAKDLKRRGFRFVGPTTAYALMQATGMVDDHVATCWRAGSLPRGLRPPDPPAQEGPAP